MDAAGNLYVTDATDNRIRKIDTAGIITTVAGTGVAGYTGDGGADTAATFNTPTGIAIDASGNLYVADSGNNVVRKINTSGIITTFAGTGAPGYAGDGGPATAANLTAPMSVAIDGAGNLLIADYRNNVVRKVNTSMVITTIAGNDTAGFAGDGGPATAAEFNSPNSIAFDRAGNIYISDENNQRIRIIDASGKVTTVAGSGYAGYSGDNGGALDAQFYRPMGLAIDTSNNIFIADFINSVIREVKMITLATAMPHGVTGNSSMSLYPDPADNKLNVTFSDYIAGPIKMQIQSIMGQKIYETTTRENHVLADVSTLPSGCYIINCYDRGSKFASGRFIKR
jgi:sugar lactone lactonase YvrE